MYWNWNRQAKSRGKTRASIQFFTSKRGRIFQNFISQMASIWIPANPLFKGSVEHLVPSIEVKEDFICVEGYRIKMILIMKYLIVLDELFEKFPKKLQIQANML